MQKTILLFILLFVPRIESLKKTPPSYETTSLLIPCHATHAPLLYPLLETYRKQTLLPDEIVISLSSSNEVNPSLVQKLLETPWPFPVKLELSQKRLFAGENRNRAAFSSFGDILILQDADDLPHPRRVEIIRELFQKYHIDHLMHLWATGALPETSDLLCIQLDSYEKSEEIPFIHNGNIAIARHVFLQIPWPKDPKGQDVAFNQKVYKRFRCFILKTALVTYRNELSSWKESP